MLKKQNSHLYIAGDVKWNALENDFAFPHDNKRRVTKWLRIPIARYNLRELKAHVPQKFCLWMFIAALFKIVRKVGRSQMFVN